MNKILKLTLVVVAVLGAIVGASFLPEIFNGGGGEKPPKLLTMSDLVKQTEKEWADLGDWSLELYEKQLVRINLSGLSPSNKSKLKDLSANSAIGVINGKICEEWKKANCNHNVVVMYHGAIAKICSENVNSKSDQRVLTINGVYATYTDARKWMAGELVPNSNFNGVSWRSFSEYENSVKASVARIKRSAYYRGYLSNIYAIKQGFNSVGTRLSAGRGKYYATLATSIANHYKKILPTKRTQAQLNNLRACRHRYQNEYGENNQINALAQQYASDVRDNARSQSVE